MSNSSDLGNCPECGELELTIDSASPAKESWIECGLCDFRYQKPLTEDALMKHWKNKKQISPFQTDKRSRHDHNS